MPVPCPQESFPPMETTELNMDQNDYKAKNINKGCGMMNAKEGYKTANTLLKRHFGDKHVVSDVWIKKVTDGPPIGMNDKDVLQDLADDLQNCTVDLKQLED
ncbi:hypothetical protein AC249_AIPGENE7338 [Exaiptasia diaphana]|nr:hypothetical protein AC249_AIPGENE7338 [Exaiptasia diaphana]